MLRPRWTVGCAKCQSGSGIFFSPQAIARVCFPESYRICRAFPCAQKWCAPARPIGFEKTGQKWSNCRWSNLEKHKESVGESFTHNMTILARKEGSKKPSE